LIDEGLDPSCTVKREILWRLATDPGMDRVFRELKSERGSLSQERSPDERERVLGPLFTLVFAHACNAVLPGDTSRFVQSRVPDLTEELDRLREKGGGALRPKIFAFGSAETARGAFIQAILLVINHLFGSPHLKTVATLASVALDGEVTVDEVRWAWRLLKKTMG